VSSHPLDELVHVVDRALPHVTVSTDASARTTWVADVNAHVAAGADPLAPWRQALAARQGSEHRPHVAAAFVLQWWCEVVATPLAYAAELASVVIAPAPTGLGFELASGLYPSRIVLRPGHVVVKPANHSREAALEASSAAYRQLVTAVVRDYAPEVKMSSRQRWGVVGDVWATAVRGAAGAGGRPVEPARRTSCCFIVALPGMQACASCPRLGQPDSGSR
jgi:hypothetical protein